MASELSGKTIAILVTDGFEQVELTGPQEALENAGATTEIVSPAKGEIKADAGNDYPDQKVFSRNALHEERCRSSF